MSKNATQPLIPSVLAVVLFISTGYAVAQAQQSPGSTVDSTSVDIDSAQPQSPSEPSARAEDRLKFDSSSALAWLKRLANTVNNSSFEISYVVSSNDRETLPYIWRHAVLENGEKAEQLSLLNGPGFERIRLNDKVSVFEPGYAPYSVRADKIDGPIPMAFIHYPETLNDAYNILLMGRDRISGRMAQQLRIVSKDKTRYGYYLWLDEQTGLLLKMNMYSADNRILKQVQVTQLNISNEVQRYFTNIQANQLPPVSVPNAQTDAEFLWKVSYLPVGMQKIKQKLHRLSTTGQPSEYMMLSDGLVDVSVYVMNASDVIQEDLSLTTDVTSIVSISNGRIQVTVVGDIPSVTANKIADSIVLVDTKP